jgi:hypothetical protein
LSIFALMLKYPGAIFLLLALGIQSFQNTFLVLDYYTNTSSFIKDCENKALPQMHCNGQCVLMKKLRQHENKDEQAPERKSENRSESFVFNWQHKFSNGIFFSIIPRKYPPYKAARVRAFPRYCFHPPGLTIA